MVGVHHAFPQTYILYSANLTIIESDFSKKTLMEVVVIYLVIHDHNKNY